MSEAYADTWTTFSERMDAAREAKAARDRNREGPAGRVTWAKPVRRIRLTVEDAAIRLGCSVQRVRLLLSERRIVGARKRGKAWSIPAEQQADKTYKPVVRPGTRGPMLRNLDAVATVAIGDDVPI